MAGCAGSTYVPQASVRDRGFPCSRPPSTSGRPRENRTDPPASALLACPQRVWERWRLSTPVPAAGPQCAVPRGGRGPGQEVPWSSEVTMRTWVRQGGEAGRGASMPSAAPQARCPLGSPRCAEQCRLFSRVAAMLSDGDISLEQFVAKLGALSFVRDSQHWTDAVSSLTASQRGAPPPQGCQRHWSVTVEWSCGAVNTCAPPRAHRDTGTGMAGPRNKAMCGRARAGPWSGSAPALSPLSLVAQPRAPLHPHWCSQPGWRHALISALPAASQPAWWPLARPACFSLGSSLAWEVVFL